MIPEHEEMVAAIISRWRTASAQDLADGAAWYAEANAAARALAAGTNGRVSTEQTAGVIAALSPRMPWARNLHLAALLTDAFVLGADIPGGAMRARIAEALDILAGRKIAPSGRKVAAFARAILGDESAVVVDVWAMRAAGVLGRESVTAGQYASIAVAYTDAAERLGVAPRTLQATTWVTIRGGAS